MHDEELSNLYCSSCENMGEVRGEVKVLKKEHLKRSKLKCEITTDVRGARCIQPEPVLRKVQRWTSQFPAFTLRVKAGNCWTRHLTMRYSRNALHHPVTEVEIRNSVIISLIPYQTERCHYNTMFISYT